MVVATRWRMAEPQMHATHAPTTTRAKQLLSSDHLAMNRLLTQLSGAVEADDPLLGELWTRFERALREHIEFEERCLFPLLAVAHRDEIESLRAEHRRIRCALGELGIAADLHALRKASVDALISDLEQHAAREERSLYDWLDENVAVRPALRALLERHAHAAQTINE